MHPIGLHYLRDIFEGKDRTENHSLNLYFLCLAPKYLDLILWALSFGLHWKVDVHERASSHHGLRLSSCYCVIMGLVETSPKMSNFLPKYNML